MFLAFLANQVLVARARRKRSDSNHEERVGLTGAPDDRISPGTSCSRRCRMAENLLAPIIHAGH
jgi:hypothetical protein